MFEEDRETMKFYEQRRQKLEWQNSWSDGRNMQRYIQTWARLKRDNLVQPWILRRGEWTEEWTKQNSQENTDSLFSETSVLIIIWFEFRGSVFWSFTCA